MQLRRIWERWYNVLGHEIHIRIEPPEFKETVRRISRLVDDRKDGQAKKEIEAAYSRWGCDPELIRLDHLNSFLNED